MRKVECSEKMNINGNIECAHNRRIISGLHGCLCNKENCHKVKSKPKCKGTGNEPEKGSE